MAKVAVNDKQKSDRPYFTEEHVMFRDSLRKFLKGSCSLL
jgi:acyl-CoA dehydrogenase